MIWCLTPQEKAAREAEKLAKEAAKKAAKKEAKKAAAAAAAAADGSGGLYSLSLSKGAWHVLMFCVFLPLRLRCGGMACVCAWLAAVPCWSIDHKPVRPGWTVLLHAC